MALPHNLYFNSSSLVCRYTARKYGLTKGITLMATSPSKKYHRALVVGKFAPLHLGHLKVIDKAFEVADNVLILVWSNPDFPDMPNEVRANWIRDLYPAAQVLTPDTIYLKEKTPDNDASGENQRRFTILFAGTYVWPLDIDVVVSSEEYGVLLAGVIQSCEGSPVASVTLDRTELPVSGTMIREDIHENRQYLAP